MVKFYRKVIQVKATDSPNVRLALAEIARGEQPSNTILVPGVLTWAEYQQRQATWDPIRKTVGLEAEFYEGAEVKLYTPEWLLACEQEYNRLLTAVATGELERKAESIGVDPGEGEADTAFTAVDRYGIIEMQGFPTPDTSDIEGLTIDFGTRHDVPSEAWWMDRGGGGKQIADRMRKQGYRINTVAFGETVTPEPMAAGLEERAEAKEEKYPYLNRRAQMYGELRQLVRSRWGIPGEISEVYRKLRKQMKAIPLQYDGEGRLKLPPKNKRNNNSREITLVQLIGQSPDELDSLVLAVYGMNHPVYVMEAGVY